MRYLILLSVMTGLAACTNTARGPSSMTDADRVDYIQRIDVELSNYWNNNWQIKQKIDHPSQSRPQFDALYLQNDQTKKRINDLLQERRRQTSDLEGKLQLRDWSGFGPWFESTFRLSLFEYQEKFTVRNFSDYKIGGRPTPPFPLEHRLHGDYTLILENRTPVQNFAGDRNEQHPLKARLECDGDIIYNGGFLFFTSEKRSHVYEFDWYNNQINGQKIAVKFAGNVNRCTLSYHDDNTHAWTNRIQMAALDYTAPLWIKFASEIDVCARPTGFGAQDPASFFWSQDFNFDTCPQTFTQSVLLADPYKSVNEKIKALTGGELKRADFDKHNPFPKLDFSKAPKFDIIWVSSLNFSADFYGAILSQALRYHAERGTQVRILVPEVTTTKKDIALLESLQRGLPNVKIQYYEYNLSHSGDGSFIDEFHRVNHTKLLIGYSEAHPENDFVVTGGRNIRDSYIFRDAPDYSRIPFLKNYAFGEESYIYYVDFEMLFRGRDFVKSILAQMLSFWSREPHNQMFRSTNLNLAKAADPEQIARFRALPQSQPLVRHILSLPYFDGYQLEQFYIQMIDSARKELLLTTPYFRPSEAISAALDRAHQRGVQIKILTRIHLAGDGTPKIAEDVNKEGINRHLGEVDIYEWSDPKTILHAKLMVIDQKMAFVSSINLNRRSFIHDVENGILILHEKTTQEIRQEVLNFLRKGRKITAQEKISWLNSALLDWADSYF